MAVMGLLLVVGLVLTLRWGGEAYETWEPGPFGDPDFGDPPVGASSRAAGGVVVRRYLRGVAVALVGGFWAGALVTGPAMRLIMRLLAVTAGDDAQGRITEAEEVIGSIDLDGTIGLYLFGGILPGLLSGGLYLVFRRWLPKGRLAGVVFGLLHLVVAATRIDPLRPDNPDFDLVGPGWLAVLTFGLASILHGMAVVAIANRYSASFPPRAPDRATRRWAIAPLIVPTLFLVPAFPFLILLGIGLAVTVVGSQVDFVVRAVRSHVALLVGRVAVGAFALALLPGAVVDLRDVIDRDDAVESSAGNSRG